MSVKQVISIYSGDSVLKSYDIPYQVKVYYTLATTNESLTMRCGIGVIDTYDNSSISEKYLKNIQDMIKSNSNVSVEYKFNERVICKLLINSNTYVAYKTKLGDGDVLIEDLEISNPIN